MKKLILIQIILCFTLVAQAQLPKTLDLIPGRFVPKDLKIQGQPIEKAIQNTTVVSKTVNVSAGGLSNALTTAEKTTITDLIINGTIDAQDFKTMRDNMPVLAKVDLSGVNIVAYSGKNGTYSIGSNEYPENEIPTSAFYNSNPGVGKLSLVSMVMPLSAKSIGNYAFTNCIRLSIVNTPSSVTAIGNYAFYNCIGLTNINIPSTVTFIGSSAFESCSGLTLINMNSNPMAISSSTFTGVNISTCVLNVPYHTKPLYAAANYWKSFVNIIEPTSGFILDINSLKLPANSESTTVGMNANVAWSACSDQSWLTVSPGSGTGNNTLTINTQNNISETSRVGTITVSAPEFASQTITVFQAGATKTIAVTAGKLASTLSTDQLNSITDMVITGSIDARDFKTMRDNMPVLAKLDLSGVNIIAYSGTHGTYSSSSTVYPENEIPAYAFCNSSTEGNTSLVTLILPLSTKSIGVSAFEECKNLTNISIPSFVTFIGKYAFNYCTKLSYITIPSSVTSIGDYAFTNCRGITNVTIPASVTSIGDYAFYNCIKLTDIDVESGNLNYSSLAGVLFNKSQTMLIQYPKSKTAGSYIIPSLVTNIGSYAFYKCSELTNVTIPSSVTSIGNSAFSGCSGLTNVTIPASVTYIGSYAFGSCSGLTNASIPSSVTSIGVDAFYSCSGLTRINMNSKPMSISSLTFEGVNTSTCVLNVPYHTKPLYAAANYWKSFVNIVEPTSGFVLDINSLKLTANRESTTVGINANVAWSACSDQSWLTVSPGSGTGNNTLTINAQNNLYETSRVGTITVSASEFASQTITVFQAGATKTIAVTAGKLASTLSADQLNSITDMVITGSIDARDFKTMRDNMPVLAKVDLSDANIVSYTGIGGTDINTNSILYPENEIPTYAFYNSSTGGNTSLVTMILPLSTKSIGDHAFYNCKSLTNITTLTSITILGDYAFCACIRLNNFTIPASVSSIGNHAFEFCSGLTNVMIPASVNSIGDFAFYQCSGLTNITIPASVTSIGNYAFSGCSGLTNVSIPSSVTSIDDGVFNSCRGLTKITIPSSVTSIGNFSFESCTGLTNVTIPSSVTYIGRYAFRSCSGLTNVSIPSSVTSIGDVAFSYCSGLTRINMNSKPMSISSSTFEGVNTSTCVLNVPYHTKPLYAAANYWKSFVNILEPTSGFIIDINSLKLSANSESTNVGINANVTWSASSDQSWLTASPGSGTGNNALTINAQNNLSETSRVGTITVSASGFASQTITVLQAGATKTIAVTAGNLETLLSADQLNSITDMVITGSIDARDFKTMRDNMPVLAKVDLSDANIVSYTGIGGTDINTNSILYPENEIPAYAFYNPISARKSSLFTIEMPASTESIGVSAFEDCKNLTNITFPSPVIFIGDAAFGGCCGLTNLTISSSVTSIGNYAFSGCIGITNIAIPSSVIAIGTYAFYQCSGLTNVTIPSTVTYIGSYAFKYCSGLTYVSIPLAVNYIGNHAFYECTGLTSIYDFGTIPVDLSSKSNVFFNVNKTTCTLYVPTGSKKAYQTAVQWKDFTNIVEFVTVVPQIKTLNLSVYPNPFSNYLRAKGFDVSSHLSVYDLHGKELINCSIFPNEDIPVSSLPKGIYVVKIKNNKGEYVTKVMKE